MQDPEIRPIRILIYACGEPAEILDQQQQCLQLATELGPHVIVSLATDKPGERTAWNSACAMYEAGEVDRILVASRDLIPAFDPVESVTQELRIPRQGPRNDEPPWQRRPRRLGRNFKRQC